MSNYAWVTLATNDSYSLGALVVANSLKKVNTSHQTAVLITPGVSESMKSKLEAAFNAVVEVNVLDSKDAANLALLSRPELGITFTKLHCWRLTQYEKCVFLDADTFVLQNCDELFEREELSAAPDVGWPDCFNSGVFVFRPNLETFGKLIEFATKQGSFDGGDQGLLNSFFSDWAQKDISKHLPFIYNTCSTACYSYLPAFKQFGQNVKILHFIGQVKPWLLNFDSSSKTAYAPQGYGHLGEFLQQWWNVFCDDVHPALTTEMGGLAGALAQLTLGSPRSAQQQAYEESMRRQCWEAGNIDYLGKDSFDNIWKRITKTIENKNDSPSVPPTEKNRSPTPQPEELAVEAKKEVKVGPTFNESEEDVLGASQIHEHTTTEVSADGRIIEKKIVTYPAEETTEIEEIEEVDGQVMSVKRTVVGSENKPAVQPKPKTLEEIKNEPVVLVPGYKTVEIDEKTNSTTVTEKTTTGYQQTITTVQEDGTKKVQTKTFYDPVEIPGEEVEEETYEEIETFEPDTKNTTVTTVTGAKDVVDFVASGKDAGTEITEVESKVEEQPAVKQVESASVVKKEELSESESKVLVDLKNQPIVIVPGHQKVEFNKETNTTTVTEKTTTGYQQTITTVTADGRSIVQTKVFYDPVPSEQVEEVETTTTTVTEVSDSATPAVKQIVQEERVETVNQPDEIPETKDQQHATVTTTDVKDLQLVLAAPTGPISITQKKTTPGGKEVEVTTTVSEDGLTKTLRKTTRKPSEEIEIEEYEETQSYEPGEVKVITTAKTIPLVEALEDAAKDIVEDTPKTAVDNKKVVTSSIEEQVESETKVSAKQASSEAMRVTTGAKETTAEAKRTTTEANQTTTKAKQTTTEAKQTTTAAKQTTETKQTTAEAKKTIAEAKQNTTEAKETTTAAKLKTTAVKQTTTQSKQTDTEAKQNIKEAKETTAAGKKTSEAKETTTAAKQTSSSAKQVTTEAKQTSPAKPGAIEPKPTKKSEQTDASVKKVAATTKTNEKDTKDTTQVGKTTSKITESPTKTKTTTVVTKKDSPVKSVKTSSAATKEPATVGKPKVTIKDGETITEVLRPVPGGMEHTWTTVRADGSTKMEKKTVFEPVELSSSEEEEEYEEVIEEETPPVKTATTKTKNLGAVSVKGPKTPTITEATPPNTPPLKPLVIGSTSSELKAEHEIPDTPPLDRAEQLSKKKIQSAPVSKVAQKVEKSAVEAPKPPPRKKEVKKPATGK